jgi:phosphatidylserine/phosphatidylglycerophosphate/cardiolipin synthase-like enzyme
VRVEIILSNWAKRKSALPWIRSLAAAPNVAVRFTNIPESPTGYIPYARVEHAKYLIADDNACWLGTANGSRDYFHESRNVSLFVRGRTGQGVAADLAAVFATSWDGPYAEPVSPCGEYTPPRTGE